MKTLNSNKRLVLTLVLAVGLVFAVVGYAPQPVLASGPAPNQSTARFEVRFLKGMIDHHAMAVAMAEVCLEKAVHEELWSLCEQIISTQSQEIEMMQMWLADWYGIHHEPQMNPGDMRQMEKLAALDGAEFEIAFMEMMIKHHAKAIKEGEHCLDKAYHGELLAMCQNIIQTQSAEIQIMQTWLCEWYSICKQDES